MTTTELAVAVAPLPTVGSSARRRSLLRRTRRFWLVLAASVAIGVGVLVGTPLADGDTAQDLLRTLLRTPGLIGRPDWRFLPLLAALAGVHYLLAGVALRAAAGPGCRTPLGETTLVQLVATVANRLTPTGLGGAAVNSRYLFRRGLALPEAVGAVAGLNMFGAVADALALVLLLAAGAPLGVHGAGGEIRAMGGRLHGLVGLLGDRPLVWVVIALAVAGLSCLVLSSGRAGGRCERIADALARVGRRAADLVRRPRDLAVLLTSSAGTTVVLGLALVVSVAAVTGRTTSLDLGGILVGYMVGAAVGGAVPVPAGIGSTEAAMAGSIVLAHVSVGHAIAAVLLFRVVTFWGPVPFGLLATHRLRRRGAL